MRTATLAAVLALAGCAGGELTDDLYPGNVPVDADGRPTDLVFKVVSDADGSPIAGATVSLVREAAYPIPEQPERPVAVAETDAHGWVRLPIAALRGRYEWLYVQADGFGPQGINAPWLDRAVRLRRAVDLPFQIRDELNRPVAGAQVDWHLGCGHTPAVQVVVTDARGAGVLRGIDLESGAAWIKAPGLQSNYLPIEWEHGDPRAVIHVPAAPVLRGRVVDASGAPVAGAPVGAAKFHRGPWCLTGPDGSFELAGLERGESIWAAPSIDAKPVVKRTASPAGHPCTIALPAAGAKAPGWKAGRKVHLKVQDPDGTLLADLEVLAVRTADGATLQRFVQPEGQALFGAPSTGDARFDLPAGAYEFVVEHTRGYIIPLRVTVDVGGRPEDPPLEQVLTAEYAPLKKLEFDGIPSHATVWVATPGRLAWDCTDEAQQAGLVPLPPEGPAVLKLVADGHTQFVELERSREPQRITWNGPPPVDPTAVEWEEPDTEMPQLPSATLRVRVDGPDQPVTVCVDGDPTTGKAGAAMVTVEHLPEGSREVVVAAPGFRAWRGMVTLTKDKTSTLDVTLTPAAR